jgi:hypothetical protein
MGSEYNWSTLFACIQKMMKPIKNYKKWGWVINMSNRGGEYDQSPLYACIKGSQWTSLYK